MTTTQDYVVAGMTCEHCTQAVAEEVLAVAGVREVTVRLDGGTMTVASEEPVDFGVLSAAVGEAGYTLGTR